MRSAYSVVEYRSDHRSGVLELAPHIWSPDLDRNGAYFDWKYRDNPNLGPEGGIFFVVLHDGNVIGMRGLHPVRLEADGTAELTALCWGDAVIDPRHRGKGLLTPLTDALLARASEAGYRYIFGVSNNPATFFHLMKLGWKPAVPYRLLHRHTGSKHVLFRGFQLARSMPILSGLAKALQHSAQAKRVATFADRPDLFASLDDSHARETGPVAIASNPRPEAMAGLVHRLGSDGRIRLVRDADTMSWRFGSPLATHRFLFCGDPELKGYLVVQARRFDNFGVVNLVDWEAETNDVRRVLLRALLKFGHFKSLAIWSASLPIEALDLLRKEGFRQKEPPPADGAYRQGLIIGSLGDQKDEESWTMGRCDLLEPMDWDIRMTLSDSF
jgi:GNAT superfamily N-acetyltransferase